MVENRGHLYKYDYLNQRVRIVEPDKVVLRAIGRRGLLGQSLIENRQEIPSERVCLSWCESGDLNPDEIALTSS